MGATARGAYGDRSEYAPQPFAEPRRAAADDAPLTESLSEDFRLLRQVKRGERGALTEIVKVHQQAVYGYLRARLLEPADAEDLCQEVFLRCFSGQVNFDRATTLRPWLIGIARNVLREHVRQKARRREIGWTHMCLSLDELAGEEPSAANPAMDHLPNCLEALGPSARRALDMRYGADLRLADIGERLHRSEGAIKLLIFRARQALKSCLDFHLKKEQQ